MFNFLQSGHSLNLGHYIWQSQLWSTCWVSFFSQDPLERYFSRQCHRGGSNENPTAEQVILQYSTEVESGKTCQLQGRRRLVKDGFRFTNAELGCSYSLPSGCNCNRWMGLSWNVLMVTLIILLTIKFWTCSLFTPPLMASTTCRVGILIHWAEKLCKICW